MADAGDSKSHVGDHVRVRLPPRAPAVADFEAVCRAAAAGIAGRETELREEQAVRGIDSLSEGEIQGLLARGILDAGFGVRREVRYPADRSRALRSSGKRCDLVSTPERPRSTCSLAERCGWNQKVPGSRGVNS